MGNIISFTEAKIRKALSRGRVPLLLPCSERTIEQLASIQERLDRIRRILADLNINNQDCSKEEEL